MKNIKFVFILLFVFCWGSFSYSFKFYNNRTNKVPRWIKPYPFNYNPKNRPDPFKPVIKIKSLKVSKKNKKGFSPLAEYEPDQLNLVGITWDPSRRLSPLALVELPNGKGYILKEGMKIGPNDAEVVAILKDRVIIVETTVNFFGKKENKQIILNLKPQK